MNNFASFHKQWLYLPFYEHHGKQTLQDGRPACSMQVTMMPTHLGHMANINGFISTFVSPTQWRIQGALSAVIPVFAPKTRTQILKKSDIK